MSHCSSPSRLGDEVNKFVRPLYLVQYNDGKPGALVEQEAVEEIDGADSVRKCGGNTIVTRTNAGTINKLCDATATKFDYTLPPGGGKSESVCKLSACNNGKLYTGAAGSIPSGPGSFQLVSYDGAKASTVSPAVGIACSGVFGDLMESVGDYVIFTDCCVLKAMNTKTNAITTVKAFCDCTKEVCVAGPLGGGFNCRVPNSVISTGGKGFIAPKAAYDNLNDPTHFSITIGADGSPLYQDLTMEAAEAYGFLGGFRYNYVTDDAIYGLADGDSPIMYKWSASSGSDKVTILSNFNSTTPLDFGTKGGTPNFKRMMAADDKNLYSGGYSLAGDGGQNAKLVSVLYSTPIAGGKSAEIGRYFTDADLTGINVLNSAIHGLTYLKNDLILAVVSYGSNFDEFEGVVELAELVLFDKVSTGKATAKKVVTLCDKRKVSYCMEAADKYFSKFDDSHALILSLTKNAITQMPDVDIGIFGSTAGLVSPCGGAPAAPCGDSKRAATEGCDDGNTSSGDGCSATCAVEPGYTCTGGSALVKDTCALSGDKKRIDNSGFTSAPIMMAVLGPLAAAFLLY